ncbi:MAG TPA: PqqD family peptide modification chaperone [Anaerolineales bacterium]
MDVLQKKQSISLDSIAVASSELVSANLDGEVVILGFSTGSYFSLDQVGTFVWDLIQKPQNVSDLRDAILEEYEIDPVHCERDLITLLEELVDKQLIDIRAELAA